MNKALPPGANLPIRGRDLLRTPYFGENINPMQRQPFLAGSCFSPDGSVLFVNMQGDGLTLAITGPWQDQV